MNTKYHHRVPSGNPELLLAVVLVGFGLWVLVSWFLEKFEQILRLQVW